MTPRTKHHALIYGSLKLFCKCDKGEAHQATEAQEKSLKERVALRVKRNVYR